MYTRLTGKKLKDGGDISIIRVQGPDKEWTDRIAPYLAHKGELWTWQIRETLESRTVPLEANYYVGISGENLIGNICTFTHNGAGILGHVFTSPEQRRKGVCAAIMTEVIDDFRARNGLALILGTGFDSPAWHIYKGFGFEPIYPKSGEMEWYRDTIDDFEEQWFAAGPATVRPADWRDWPGLTALSIQRAGSGMRNVALRIYDRWSMEYAFLGLYRRTLGEGDTSAVVLESTANGASVGLATLMPDPRFPGVSLLDLFVHPNFSASAAELLDRLLRAEHSGKIQAYAESSDTEKVAALEAVGLKVVVELKDQIALRSGRSDVLLFEG